MSCVTCHEPRHHKHPSYSWFAKKLHNKRSSRRLCCLPVDNPSNDLVLEERIITSWDCQLDLLLVFSPLTGGNFLADTPSKWALYHCLHSYKLAQKNQHFPRFSRHRTDLENIKYGCGAATKSKFVYRCHGSLAARVMS